MRILVCHPERHIVKLLQANLERQGHEVTSASDADDAVALLEDQTFEVASIDPEMTDSLGRNLTERIRAHESSKLMKVVEFGGKTKPHDFRIW